MIVILEDNEDRQTMMRECLSKLEPHYPIHFFTTAFETIDWLKAHLQETVLIALDHDLEMIAGDHRKLIDPGTGREVADYLATQSPVCSVIIHTTNTPAGVGMETTLKEAGWKTKRLTPYGNMEWIPELWFPTVRKLLPTVESAHPTHSGDSDDQLEFRRFPPTKDTNMDPETLSMLVRRARNSCRVVGWEDCDNDYEREVVGHLIQRVVDAGQPFCHIFCQPSLARYLGGPPDIVFISPVAGVHVIEVKGIQLSQVLSVDGGGEFQIQYSHGRQRCNAIAQVRRAMFSLKNAAERDYATTNLLADLSIPFSAWVALPRISTASWNARWSPPFRHPHLLFQDDVPRLADRLLANGEQQLGGQACWPEAEINSVFRAFGDNAVLYPTEESRCGRHAGAGTIGAYLDELIELDRHLSDDQQQLSCQNWKSGPRLIRGVVGSGKSIVLANNLARRIEIASREQQDLFEGGRARLLAVCFNRAFVPFIRERIRQAFAQRTGSLNLPNSIDVEVIHLNGLMHELAQQGLFHYEPIDGAPPRERAISYIRQLRLALESDPESVHELCFDAIYIDEAQDFEPEEFELLVRLWRPSRRDNSSCEPRVYIFYDDAQNLYGRTRPTWNSIGLNLVGGRSHVLTECFRSTRQIVEFAFNVLYGVFASKRVPTPPRDFGDVSGLIDRGLVEDQETPWRVRFASREGPPPTLIVLPTRDDENKQVIARVRELVVDQYVRPQDVLILSHRNNRIEEIGAAIRDANIPGIHHVHIVNEDRDARLSQPGHLTVSTVHSAKGFDAFFVLFVSIEQIPTTIEGRATFYVGCTRAIEILDLFSTDSEANLIPEIQRAVNSCINVPFE